MALIKCPECGQDVSDKAEKCLHCGYGVEEHFRKIKWEKQEQVARENEERRKREEFERKKANIKMPKKNTGIWIFCITISMLYGALNLFVIIISFSQREPFELIFFPITSILLFFVFPIWLYKRHNKKYKEIQNNQESYKIKQTELQIAKEEKQRKSKELREHNMQVVMQSNSGLRCKKCGSSNISVSFQTTGSTNKTVGEVRKKSAATRAGNKAGRAGMIMATGGLWALTPKKSDYKAVQKGKSKASQVKMAICQDCGKSWRVL